MCIISNGKNESVETGIIKSGNKQSSDILKMVYERQNKLLGEWQTILCASARHYD